MFKITPFDLSIANVFLVEAGDKKVLIDTAEHGREIQLEKALAKVGVQPKDISLVICTHGHYDHAGGAKYLKEKYGIPVMLGAGDIPMVASEKMPHLSPYTFGDLLVRTFIANKTFIPAFVPDYAVSQDFDLRTLGIDGDVMVLPGHTHGSLAIAFGKNVFVGDLFRGGLVSHGTACRHFFKPEVDKTRENVQKLLDKGYDMFYCGHSGPVARANVESRIGKLS